jgi:hypothetical protein
MMGRTYSCENRIELKMRHFVNKEKGTIVFNSKLQRFIELLPIDGVSCSIQLTQAVRNDNPVF